MQWECNKGHVFESRSSSVKSGKWCKKCSDEARKLSIEEFQELAKIKGGKLLSEIYIDSNTAMQWECAKGQSWSATPSAIKVGYWCRKCFADRRRGSTELFRKIADEKGGTLLSKEHINDFTRLKFQCSEGHIWLAIPSHIKKGNWCRICARKAVGESLRYTIADLQKYASSRDGSVLSEKYISSQHHIKWQCGEGHVWLAMPGSVLNKKSWCGVCAVEKRRMCITVFQQIAVKKGGKLLSDKYINQKTHLTFECIKGHTWKAAPQDIKQGTWCPVCLR